MDCQMNRGWYICIGLLGIAVETMMSKVLMSYQTCLLGTTVSVLLTEPLSRCVCVLAGHRLLDEHLIGYQAIRILP